VASGGCGGVDGAWPSSVGGAAGRGGWQWEPAAAVAAGVGVCQ